MTAVALSQQQHQPPAPSGQPLPLSEPVSASAASTPIVPASIIFPPASVLGPVPAHSSPLTRSIVHHPSIICRWVATIERMSAVAHLPAAQLADIRSFITEGIPVRLHSAPPPTVYSNSPSVAMHHAEVHVRLLEYIDWGAVVPLDFAPPRIQPLLVVIRSDRRPRLCIDLSRNLNDHITVPHFSYSSVSTAVDLSYGGCWYVKLDLSNCFLSFPLHPDAVEHFCFSFGGRYYAFVRMPFGLAPAPLYCTQLLSVVAFDLQQQGIALVRYLDDFLLVCPSAAVAHRQLAIALSTFAHYGLVVNPAKTEGPAQSITFLGVRIDSIAMTLSVTDERMKELHALISSFLTSTVRCSSIALLSLVGKLSFAATCLPGARPFMRRLLDSVNHNHMRALVRLTPSFYVDLRYWHARLSRWNHSCSWLPSTAPLVLVTDASTTGFGFHIRHAPPAVAALLPAHMQPGSGFMGIWSPEHVARTSSHRNIQWSEFFSALSAVLCYSPYAANHSILLLMDNSSDVNVINRQSSRNAHIAVLLRALYDLSFRYHFSVRAQHIAGESNVLADFLSRPALHRHAPMLHWDHSVLPLCVVSVVPSSSVVLTELIDSSAIDDPCSHLCRLSSSSA